MSALPQGLSAALVAPNGRVIAIAALIAGLALMIAPVFLRLHKRRKAQATQVNTNSVSEHVDEPTSEPVIDLRESDPESATADASADSTHDDSASFWTTPSTQATQALASTRRRFVPLSARARVIAALPSTTSGSYGHHHHQ